MQLEDTVGVIGTVLQDNEDDDVVKKVDDKDIVLEFNGTSQ